MFLGECNGILSNDRLTSRCVSSNKDRVAQFEMVDRLFLESVKFKRVLRAGHRGHLRNNKGWTEKWQTLRARFGTRV